MKTPKLIARALFGGLFALGSIPAFADCSGDMCSNVRVEQLYIESGYNNWIKTTGTETNLTVCTPDSGVLLWLDGTANQKKEVIAILMMAYSLDKPVSIRLTTGARGCAIAYVLLDR